MHPVRDACVIAVVASLAVPACAQTTSVFQQTNIPETHVTDQLTVRVGQVTGSDVVLFGSSVLNGSLTGNDTWRRVADLQYTLPNTHGFDGMISLNAFDLSRPSPFLGLIHGFGRQFGLWQRNSVSAIVLHLNQESWSLASGFSVSEYLGVRTAFSHYAQHLEGESQWHTLTFTPWQSGSDHLQLHITYGISPSRYRSFDPNLDTPLLYDGRTVDVGLDYKSGRYGMTASYQSSGDQEIWIQEAKTDMTTPLVTLSLARGVWGYAFSTTDTNVYDIWSRQAYLKMAAKITLPQLPVIGWLSPKYLKLDWRDEDTTSQGEALADIKRTPRIGLSWSGLHTTTDVSYAQSTLQGYTGSNGYGRGKETTLEFLQTYSVGAWGLSAYVDVDRTTKGSPQGLSSDSFLAGGGSVSYIKLGYPKVQLGIDYNNYLSIIPGFQSNLLSRGVSFRLSVDFSSFLPAPLLEHSAHLILKAFTDFSVDKSLVSTVKVGQVAFVDFGLKF